MLVSDPPSLKDAESITEAVRYAAESGADINEIATVGQLLRPWVASILGRSESDAIRDRDGNEMWVIWAQEPSAELEEK